MNAALGVRLVFEGLVVFLAVELDFVGMPFSELFKPTLQGKLQKPARPVAALPFGPNMASVNPPIEICDAHGRLPPMMKTMFQRFVNLNGIRVVGPFMAIAIMSAAPFCQGQVTPDKLLATAKTNQEQADQLRTLANAKLQEAADDEAMATLHERIAHIEEARAMAVLKADANKQHAFQLRQEARDAWKESSAKSTASRNDEQKAAHFRANADELQKAAVEVKDQPAVADGLTKDANAQLAQAQALEQSAKTEKTQSDSSDKRADSAWAEAERLDPETHKAVAAKPARPELKPTGVVK
jgi:hypothetical protein